MKPFKFQQFSIEQRKDVFRVGTDGVLLGALCSAKSAETILEVGTGTGLIALMLAQKNPIAKITALDIDGNAVDLATHNFKKSSFSERLKAEKADFKNYTCNKKYALIVSNPPYFEENQSVRDVLARQKLELDFLDLISKSSHLLTGGGVFSVIIPSAAANGFVDISKKFNLKLFRKINIYGIESGELKRNILEFSFQNKKLNEENFVIEKSPRKYSDQYLKLTKAFHIFKAN